MEKYNSTDNNKELIKSCVCDKVSTKETSFDFTLPDYQPEIKRLLRIGAEVISPQCSFGMSDCEIYGTVDYYVIYLGSDNQMYCAPLSAEYRINVPIEDDMGLSYDGDVFVGCEFVNGRVTAPRKISIRSRLCARASIFNNIALENEFSDGAEPSCMQKLEGELSAAQIKRLAPNKIEVSDQIILDKRDGEIRVICAEGKALVTETQNIAGAVNCKGDVYVKLIACSDGGDVPYVMNRKIPFAVSFATDVPLDGGFVSAKGCVSELTVTVDEGRILIDAGVSVSASVVSNKTVTYTKDMYSTLCATKCDYFSPGVMVSRGGFNTNLTLGETRTLEELKLASGLTLVDTSANAMIDSTDVVDSKAKVSGKIKYTLLLYRDGEYIPTEMEFPFVYTTDVKPGANMVVADCSVITQRGRIDGERLGLDCEIYISASIYGTEKINALTALHFGELVKRNNGNITVCFPSSSDSLWSVGKRYSISTDKVLEDNKISEVKDKKISLDSKESLLGAHHLVISS